MMAKDTSSPPGFTFYNRTFRSARRWKITAAVLFVGFVVQSERLGQANRRSAKPLVITKGAATGEAPQIIKAEDLENPEADANDARNFLRHMVQWRMGWSSPTVLRDAQAYLNQCYSTQRLKDLAYFEEEVQSRTDATKKVRRKEVLVAQNVQNTIVFPQWRNIECKRDDNKVWFCMMDVAVITQELSEPYATLAPKYWLIKATLLPVDFTPATSFGLVMADFGMIPNKQGDA